MYIGYHTELAESSPVCPENLLQIHSGNQQSNRWSAKNPVGVPEDSRRCSNIVPPYSGGTKAANMPDATSDAEKRQRMERLLTLQREIATKNYKRFLGRTMRVLVEGDSKRGDGWLFGKSNEAIIVEFMGDRSLIGTFVSVQITESKNWAVSGRLLDDERKEAVQK